MEPWEVMIVGESTDGAMMTALLNIFDSIKSRGNEPI